MGKFYEMINDFHDSTKKWNPLTHYALDLAHDSSTKLVGETSHMIGDVGGNGKIGDFGRHWDEMADKDKADFGRWFGNTVGAAAAVYGGMSAAAGSGSGASTAGTGAGGWTQGSGGMYTLAGEGGGTTAATGLAEPAAGAGAGSGGFNWQKALSGGLRGTGDSMSQSAQQRGSTYDRRTAELLAEILREQNQKEAPGWINPNRAFGDSPE